MSTAPTHLPVCIWDVAAKLGEGPIWQGDGARLRMVDIKLSHTHAFDPRTGCREMLKAGGSPGFIVLTSGGGLAADVLARQPLASPAATDAATFASSFPTAK